MTYSSTTLQLCYDIVRISTSLSNFFAGEHLFSAELSVSWMQSNVVRWLLRFTLAESSNTQFGDLKLTYEC